MRRLALVLAAFVVVSCFLFTNSLQAQSAPTLFVQSSGDFGTALTAALVKKNVPVVIVTDQSKADYVLQAAPVYSKDESGAGKIARCMFADCNGMNGFSSVSVELVRSKDSA